MILHNSINFLFYFFFDFWCVHILIFNWWWVVEKLLFENFILNVTNRFNVRLSSYRHVKSTFEKILRKQQKHLFLLLLTTTKTTWQQLKKVWQNACLQYMKIAFTVLVICMWLMHHHFKLCMFLHVEWKKGPRYNCLLICLLIFSLFFHSFKTEINVHEETTKPAKNHI